MTKYKTNIQKSIATPYTNNFLLSEYVMEEKTGSNYLKLYKKEISLEINLRNMVVTYKGKP